MSVNNETRESLLFDIHEAIANIPSSAELFQKIYAILKPIFHFDLAVIQLLSDDKQFVEVFLPGIQAPQELIDFHPERRRMRIPVSEFPHHFDLNRTEIHRFRMDELPKPANIEEQEFRNLFIDVLGIRDQIVCPLMHSGEHIGHMFLAGGKRGRFPEHDMPLLRQVCKVIASAVVNTVAFEKLSAKEQDTESVLRFMARIQDRADFQGFARVLAQSFSELRPCQHFYLEGLELDGEMRHGLALDESGGGWHSHTAFPSLAPLCAPSPIGEKTDVCYLDAETLVRHGFLILPPDSKPSGAGVLIRLFLGEQDRVSILLTDSSPDPAMAIHRGIFEQAAPHLFSTLRALLHWERLQALQHRLQLENRELFKEISATSHDLPIVGDSPAFRHSMELARQVAPLDTTVLLLGETGTGKEVVARYLHLLSPRHHKPLVRVNCASLPSQLIESELFGHEKGAFTGAVERRIGKFELAQGGTIFLDEIGELPLESQAKLLRVLQERELERLGGKGSIAIDVRVLAATNRDLEAEVRAGRFRADLYFRLAVFPISLPPLRERLSDIPALADTFLDRFCRRFGRPLRPLRPEQIAQLQAYPWPGNIRELEHTLERAVITSRQGEANLAGLFATTEDSASETTRPLSAANAPAKPVLELDALIRQHIVDTLRLTGGKVSGEGGAATLLGINGKTLDSKMRKYKIVRKIAID